MTAAVGPLANAKPSGEAAATEVMFKRIAIADDDPDTLDLMAEILHGLATEICRAGSGAELTVLLAENGPFDLIVTDIDMPWVEGLAVIRSARAAEIQAPVLIVSGLSRSKVEARVTGLGNVSLLQKPFDVAGFRHAVAELRGSGARQPNHDAGTVIHHGR
jgi:DNA-binding response OmpR family regulator